MRVARHAVLAQHSTSHAPLNAPVAEEVHPIATLRLLNEGDSRNLTEEAPSLELRHPPRQPTLLKRLLHCRLTLQISNCRRRASVRLKRSIS